MPIPPPPPAVNRVNQRGEPIDEETLFSYPGQTMTDAEVRKSVGLILWHLKKEIVRTNATKHGNVELELRDIPE